jgi:CrcB protein
MIRYAAAQSSWRTWFGYEATAAAFPWPTFTVNIVGALAIGLLWNSQFTESWPQFWRVAVFTGLLGGLTTFSTFMLDFGTLVRDDVSRVAILYLISSIIFGLLAVFAGFWIGAKWFS